MSDKAIIFNTRVRGFTLIEAISVMVVIGLLSVMVVPQVVGALQSFRLNAAVGKVLSDIRYARELALSRHATYGIEVSAAENSYSIFSISGGVKTVLSDPMTQKTMTIDFDLLTQYSGVTIGSVDFCDGVGCPSVDLRFDSFGVPYDSSGAAMASSATMALSAGGTTRTITIYQQTAFSEAV